MARIARPIDQFKIRALQEQISDPEYLESAVERLAGRITAHILGIEENAPLRTTHQRAARSSNNDIAVFLDDEE